MSLFGSVAVHRIDCIVVIVIVVVIVVIVVAVASSRRAVPPRCEDHVVGYAAATVCCPEHVHAALRSQLETHLLRRYMESCSIPRHAKGITFFFAFAHYPSLGNGRQQGILLAFLHDHNKILVALSFYVRFGE
jgi:hypothetical protein